MTKQLAVRYKKKWRIIGIRNLAAAVSAAEQVSKASERIAGRTSAIRKAAQRRKCANKAKREL